MDEALKMARMAVADGISTMVATPHQKMAQWPNEHKEIAHAAGVFDAWLQKEQIPLTLHYAAEIHLGPKTASMLRQGRAPLLNLPDAQGEGRIPTLLLEFPHQGVRPGTAYMVELLVQQGYRPLIAHPERIRTFREDLNALEPYIAMGCLSQITAASLTGGFGEAVGQVADELLKRGWAHIIASDGHRLHKRQPVIKDGVKLAAQLVGQDQAEAMVTHHPWALLQGKTLD
uniref:protein-tyrosine-phosphatase n=1 Tax=Magnetococcus massalia (strain MO-1) TaxID=451514 RepID=A0A1S7LJA1_MAGMO|nr:putative protein tyrosine-phosphatase [Candidatus Magnetococcus massalia]